MSSTVHAGHINALICGWLGHISQIMWSWKKIGSIGINKSDSSHIYSFVKVAYDCFPWLLSLVRQQALGRILVLAIFYVSTIKATVFSGIFSATEFLSSLTKIVPWYDLVSLLSFWPHGLGFTFIDIFNYIGSVNTISTQVKVFL